MRVDASETIVDVKANTFLDFHRVKQKRTNPNIGVIPTGMAAANSGDTTGKVKFLSLDSSADPGVLPELSVFKLGT